jgi:hypothetical protein
MARELAWNNAALFSHDMIQFIFPQEKISHVSKKK